MILPDTNVSIDHSRAAMVPSAACWMLRYCDPPFVVGEIALGSIREREAFLGSLRRLPELPCADDDEVLHFIRRHGLHGRGIGYVDAHLLAAARLSSETRLWTRDKRLAAVDVDLGLAA